MVQNLTSPRSGNAVPNQFVIRANGKVYFQSYRTLVAMIDENDKVVLSSNWNYSKTTLRYLYQFLRNFAWYDDLNSAKVRKYIADGTFKYVHNIEM